VRHADDPERKLLQVLELRINFGLQLEHQLSLDTKEGASAAPFFIGTYPA
jgi:hypothetical protein